MRVLAVWSIKGGVGKTTTAAALATMAARDGLRTLLWDLDPQGALSHWFRVKPRRKAAPRELVRRKAPLAELARATDFGNLDLLPADLSHRAMESELATRRQPARRLSEKLADLGGQYDLALLDCAPSVTVVSEAVLAAAHAVVVPVVPSLLSLRTLEQMREFRDEVGRKKTTLVPFLTMVDGRRRLHRDNAATLAGEGGFCATVIPMASAVERAAEARTPLPLAAPRSTAGRAYEELWQELKERLQLLP